jgi:cyclase
MRRVIVLGFLLALGGLSLAVKGSQGRQGGQRGGGAPQGPPVAEIQKVRDNLYMLTGGGGNTAVFITDRGVVVVDTKNAGWGQAILDKIRTVSNKPVTMLINTHTHGDHNGSNEFFGTTVEIVAQENTKTYMEKMDAFSGDKSKFLPGRTFKDHLTLLSGKDQIDLHYFGPGHTGGDAWVVFKSLRVLHAADMFWMKSPPIIDTANGGSAVNFGNTVAKAGATLKDVDTIITGHSTLMNPADLMEFADFNNDFIGWVRGEIKARKSVDDAAAEYKIPDKYKGYTINAAFGGVKANIQAAYNELKK